MKNSFVEFLSNTKIEVISFLVALFIPTITGLMFIGLLVFADTLTGVWKVMKNEGWQGVKSRNLSDGLLPKLFMYPLILLISSGCKHIFPDVPFIRGGIFLLMCIELKSLTENLNIILKINFFNYLKAFVSKGRKGLLDEVFKDEKE